MRRNNRTLIEIHHNHLSILYHQSLILHETIFANPVRLLTPKPPKGASVFAKQKLFNVKGISTYRQQDKIQLMGW